MDAEIGQNAAIFRANLRATVNANFLDAEQHAAKLDASYARLTTFQAWREFVLEEDLSDGAMGFLTEAQNDGLISNLLVQAGLWRPSLKSLRSVIENIVHCVYYKDHPVEYLQWENGQHKPQFSALFTYLGDHPKIASLPAKLNPVSDIKNQYARLSNAVHSSVKLLRMTNESGKINLGKISSETIGKWNKEQGVLLRNCNLLLLGLYGELLSGTARMGLRKSIPLAVPKSLDSTIKSNLGVTLLR